MAKPVSVKGKVLKKEWRAIKATPAFDSQILGETYVSDPAIMQGRMLTVNLANLTGDIRQQGISLKFEVDEVTDGVGVASIIGYESSSTQLRRLVRRGVERLDDSINCTTSEGRIIKVKPFAVTRAGASKTKVSLVRKQIRTILATEIAKMTTDELVKSIISNKLQASLKTSLKKLMPLRAVEIRKLKVLESA